MQVYLWDKFPEVVLLGQSIFAFVILTDITKQPSIGVLLVQIPTSNVQKSPVSSQPCQQDMFLICWIFANLIGEKWDYSIILISIFIMYELCIFLYKTI